MELDERINFYENTQQTKARILKNETERIQLEKEFLKSTNSDDYLTKTKAAKLQAYYKKLCDDEQASMQRNQQLLADLASIETKYKHLEERLVRLAKLKNECQSYVEVAYSNWAHENKEKQMDNLNKVQIDKQSNIIESLLAISNKRLEMPNKFSTTLFHNDQISKLYDQIYDKHVDQIDNISNYQIKSDDENQKLKSQDFLKNLLLKPVLYPNELNEQYMKIQNDPLRYSDSLGNLNKPEDYLNLSSSLNKPPSQGTNINDNLLIREYQKELERQELNNQQNFDVTGTLNELRKSFDKEQQQNFATTLLLRNIQQQQNAYTADYKETNEDSNEEYKRRKNSLRQELNMKSLFRLLDFIESDMTQTIHPQKYYRQEEPHYKTKLEIIKCARENGQLKDLDAGNISMVVHDQLSHVIRKNTKIGCILTREILSFSVADISDQIVQRHIQDSKALEIWQRLIQHWCILRRFGSIDSATIGNLFAQSLIGQDAYGAEKAAKFIEKILNSLLLYEDNQNSDSNTSADENYIKSNQLEDSNHYQAFIEKANSESKKKQILSGEEKEINKSTLPKTSDSIPKVEPSKTIIESVLKSSETSKQIQDLTNRDLNSSNEKTPKTVKFKEKKPVHLRNYQDSDIDDSEITAQKSTSTHSDIKSKRIDKELDADFEFYN